MEVNRTRQNETYISDGETISELLGRVSGSGSGSGSGLPLLVSQMSVDTPEIREGGGLPCRTCYRLHPAVAK